MKEKKYIVQWISPFQTAKVVSVVSGVCGVLFGVITYLSYLFLISTAPKPGADGSGTPQLPPVEQLQPTGFILIFLLYLVAGFFIGYVGALVYNILAKKIGGIEIGLKEK